MDNCLLSDTKILPNWYIKILSYFPDFRTSNNFFNDNNLNLYKMTKPKFATYSLNNIYDIFKLHPSYNNKDVTLIKYENETITLFEYSPATKLFKSQKVIKNNLSIDYDFINIVECVLSNDPKLILTEELFIGILYSLKINHITIPNLKDILSNLNHNECLKYYKSSYNYNFIYNAFDNLLDSFGVQNSTKIKRNEYKINFDIPNKILISTLTGGGDVKTTDFKNGKTINSKKDIIFHSIILTTILGRFCKQTGYKIKKLSVEYVIQQYLSSISINLREDILSMIKIMEYSKIFHLKNQEYYLSPNYENSVYDFFTNSSYWWSITASYSKYYKIKFDKINQISHNIFNDFKKLSKDNFVKVSCHSGCDNTFIEKCSKINNSLLFIETLPMLFSSSEYSPISASTNNRCEYKNIDINYGAEIKLYTDNGSLYADLNNSKKLSLLPIFSKDTIIESYKNSDISVVEYNLNKIRFPIIDLIKIEIAQDLLFIKDSILNNYVNYTSDPSFRLLSHLYGGNLIYERVSNGNRYLEIYNNIKSEYKI